MHCKARRHAFMCRAMPAFGPSLMAWAPKGGSQPPTLPRTFAYVDGHLRHVPVNQPARSRMDATCERAAGLYLPVTL